MKLNIPHCIVLYNRGVLTVKSDPWFYKNGYRIIRRGGKVINIVADIA